MVLFLPVVYVNAVLQSHYKRALDVLQLECDCGCNGQNWIILGNWKYMRVKRYCCAKFGTIIAAWGGHCLRNGFVMLLPRNDRDIMPLICAGI